MKHGGGSIIVCHVSYISREEETDGRFQIQGKLKTFTKQQDTDSKLTASKLV